MLSLPDYYPDEAATLVADMIDGTCHFHQDAFATAAWNLIGFGMRQLYATSDLAPPWSLDTSIQTPADISRILKGRGAINWQALVPALVQVTQMLASRSEAVLSARPAVG